MYTYHGCFKPKYVVNKYDLGEYQESKSVGKHLPIVSKWVYLSNNDSKAVQS